MVQDYWQILHKYTVNINLLIIGYDWVSKFTLSLLSALKVSITFDRAMNGIHCLNRSNRIHYWCYSNQWCRYIIHVYLHGKSSQRKGDIQIFEVESTWKWGGFQVHETSYLYIKSKPERSLTLVGFLPQNGVESSQKLDVHSKS